MTVSATDRHVHSGRGAAWRIDPASATFELRLEHPLGPARVSAAFRHVDGLLRWDPDGGFHIGFAVDTDSLDMTGRRTDPRLRSHRFVADPDASPVVLFESTSVVDEGQGRLRATGELVVGARSVPLKLTVDVWGTERALELTAVVPADHRRLGVTWLPLGELRAPPELVLHADLTPVPDNGTRRTERIGDVGAAR